MTNQPDNENGEFFGAREQRTSVFVVAGIPPAGWLSARVEVDS
jgi:hypothetical protein